MFITSRIPSDILPYPVKYIRRYTVNGTSKLKIILIAMLMQTDTKLPK